MVSVFLTLAVCATVLLIFYLRHKYAYWGRRGIPTPKGCIPLIGHILPVLLSRMSLSELCQKVYEENKNRSMVGLYKFTTPLLVVQETPLVKTVLQNNFSGFQENGMKINPDLDPLLATNPFFSHGEQWQTGRKRLTYAFSNVRLRILYTAVTGVCKKFQDYLSKHVNSKDKLEIELKNLFAKFTGEVVANAGLGIEGQCFEDTKNKYAFDTLGKDMFHPNTVRDMIVTILLFIPSLSKYVRLPFVPKYIDGFFRQAVHENLECRRKEPVPRNDFLQLMIDLEKTGEKVDVDVIAAHAFSFFLDGYETSSTTLAFVGYHLAIHPDIQEKLREEIQTTVAKHNGELTFDAVKEMKYMDQVLSESQRCIPALGELMKICTKESELQGSDGLKFVAKPGTEIVIPVHALHMSSKYWTDPKVFDPDRFGDERKGSIDKMAFLPFGEGPRMCVGMRMALLQMKACLATLLMNYRVELSPKTKLPLKFLAQSILLTAKSGLWVYLMKL